MSDLPELPAILLVDDEPEILHSLKALLRRKFSLHTAENGAEALEILKDNTIQVVMTDQRMPEMNGSELLHHVGRISPDTVRIIFTGYADIRAVVEAVNCGDLFRYITKPWDPEQLIETLALACREYQRRKDRDQLLHDAIEFCNEAIQCELGDDLTAKGSDLVSRIMHVQNIDHETC